LNYKRVARRNLHGATVEVYERRVVDPYYTSAPPQWYL
jgi:hypothetical protein